MKAAVCVILLFLALLRQGKALTCNYCYSKGGGLCTATTTQICTPRDNACAAVVFEAPFNYSFRSCMNMAVCQGFIQTPRIIATCCSTDLCN